MMPNPPPVLFDGRGLSQKLYPTGFNSARDTESPCFIHVSVNRRMSMFEFTTYSLISAVLLRIEYGFITARLILLEGSVGGLEHLIAMRLSGLIPSPPNRCCSVTTSSRALMAVHIDRCFLLPAPHCLYGGRLYPTYMIASQQLAHSTNKVARCGRNQ